MFAGERVPWDKVTQARVECPPTMPFQHGAARPQENGCPGTSQIPCFLGGDSLGKEQLHTNKACTGSEQNPETTARPVVGTQIRALDDEFRGDSGIQKIVGLLLFPLQTTQKEVLSRKGHTQLANTNEQSPESPHMPSIIA